MQAELPVQRVEGETVGEHVAERKEQSERGLLCEEHQPEERLILIKTLASRLDQHWLDLSNDLLIWRVGAEGLLHTLEVIVWPFR